MTTHPIEVDCKTVKAKLDSKADFLLLDCREKDEYELVHIAGAMLVPMSEIQQRVGELEAYRDREIIVHCHHGGRSMRVTNWLRQQGYSKAQNMAGGIDDWAVTIDPAMPRY